MKIISFFGFDLSPEKYEYLVNIPREKLLGWLEAGIAILPNFAVAIITLLMFYPLAKLAKWLAGKIYRERSDNQVVRALVQNIVFLVVLFIGIFSALEILKLEKTVASLLAGAGVVGLAMGFAFQEIASNFVSGILISFRKPYRIGDIVEVQGRRGMVKSIDLRTTSIMMANGIEVIIPNKQMITDVLMNYTSTRGRRAEVIVGVSYNSDLEKVRDVTLAAIQKIPQRIKEREVEFYYTSFNQSSIDFRVTFWTDYPENNDFDLGIHNAVISIKKAFDENGISIPYPTRTIIKQN